MADIVPEQSVPPPEIKNPKAQLIAMVEKYGKDTPVGKLLQRVNEWGDDVNILFTGGAVLAVIHTIPEAGPLLNFLGNNLSRVSDFMAQPVVTSSDSISPLRIGDHVGIAIGTLGYMAIIYGANKLGHAVGDYMRKQVVQSVIE